MQTERKTLGLKRGILMILAAVCFFALLPGKAQASSWEDGFYSTWEMTWDYTWDEASQGYVVSRYRGNETVVTVPASYDGMPVTGMGACFQYNDTVTEVVVPESVKNLSKFTFVSCPQLRRVEFQGGIETLPNQTFDGCAQLTEVILPPTLKELGSYVFNSCPSLKALTLPEGVLRIGKYAFSRAGIEELFIPASVEEVPEYAFMNTPLKSVTISARQIDDYAFYDCQDLYQVILDDNVKKIGENALYSCNKDSLTIVAPKDSYAASYAAQNQLATTTSRKVSQEKMRSTALTGEKLRLHIFNTPDPITWSTSKKSVATVSEQGVVSMKKTGSVTISAKVGEKKYSWKFNVKARTQNSVLNLIYRYYVTRDMTDKEKVTAANQWLAANVSYDTRLYTAGNVPDVSFTAKGALEKGVAVCDGYAKAFKLIMDHYGIPCKRVVGTGNGQSHAWNLVQIGSKWYHVDTTWNDPIYVTKDGSLESRETADTEYLLVTDSVLKKDHKWKTSQYPKANTKKVNANVTHTGISGAVLNRRTAALSAGDTTTFTVTGTKKTVKYKTSDKKVATVNSKGKVTAKGPGTAKITITIGNSTYTCVVTVKGGK